MFPAYREARHLAASPERLLTLTETGGWILGGR